MSDFEKLVETAYLAALNEPESLLVWGRNPHVFRSLLGPDLFWQLAMCVRRNLIEGMREQ
jgi:hypothetical protein